MPRANQRRVDKAGPRVSRLWYGKKLTGQNVYDAACDRVEQLYRQFDHVCVLFSAGKDSTAAFNVTLEVARALGKLPLRVVFGDEEVMTPDTVDYAQRVADRPDVAFEWYCLPWKHRNACASDSPFWYPWAPEDRGLWVRPLPPSAIVTQKGFSMKLDERIPTTEWNALVAPPKLYGRSALVMGIRASESQVRRRAVANGDMDPWLKQLGALRPGSESSRPVPGVFKAYVIYDWTVKDVWTATGKFKWDYNRTYEVFEMLGLARHYQRIAPPFGEEPRAQLWVWARAYPQLWEKMCSRVPGVLAAARYARTEIYTFGGSTLNDSLKTGPEWRRYLRQLIDRQPANVQAGIAHTLELWIGRHYNRTPDPILPTTPHPETGLCWSDLAMLAETGDFKKRQNIQPYAAPGTATYEKQRLAYQAALIEWLRTGESVTVVESSRAKAEQTFKRVASKVRKGSLGSPLVKSSGSPASS